MGLSTGNGVQQWIFQRFANIVTLVFVAVLFIIILKSPTHESLTALFSQVWFKIYLTLTLVFGALNSILAGWQIAGDYAQKIHLPVWPVLGVILLVTMVYFLFGLILIF